MSKVHFKKRETAVTLIRALEAELASPEHTRKSPSELHAALVAQVDEWHDHGVGLVSASLQSMAEGQHVTDLLQPEAQNYSFDAEHAGMTLSTIADQNAVDARGTLVFLLGKDAVLQKLQLLVDGMATGADAETRAERLVDIKRRLQQAEAAEEAAILELEDQGIEWVPRAGQRPEAAILVGWGK
ncbi:hypothetical protein SRS16CHR_01800 [Variovorax sp. SRS16]|uniref:hypothetical protein n=1 Tax=Variovorax sp. SRS16 TaxID=282217 RepID=UPI001316963F|nr:hypothetical protein [Variovorax sp. SRS16]VTU16534.1 hypothetical protein SRS16CHR_01800 [Variovorax sp. SRS16]